MNLRKSLTLLLATMTLHLSFVAFGQECPSGYEGRQCRHEKRLKRLDAAFDRTFKRIRASKQSKAITDQIKWFDAIETTFPYVYWDENPFGYDDLKKWEQKLTPLEPIPDKGDTGGGNDIPSPWPIIFGPKNPPRDCNNKKCSTPLSPAVTENDPEQQPGQQEPDNHGQEPIFPDGDVVSQNPNNQDLPVKPATEEQIESIARCLVSNSENCSVDGTTENNEPTETVGTTTQTGDGNNVENVIRSLQVVQLPLCDLTIKSIKNNPEYDQVQLEKFKQACGKNGYLFSAYKKNKYHLTQLEGGINELTMLQATLEGIKERFSLKSTNENDFVLIKGSADYLPFQVKPKLPVSYSALTTCRLTEEGKIEYKTINPTKLSTDSEGDYLMDNEMLAYVRAYMVKQYLTRNIGLIPESTKVCLYGEGKTSRGENMKDDEGNPEDRAVGVYLVRYNKENNDN